MCCQISHKKNRQYSYKSPELGAFHFSKNMFIDLLFRQFFATEQMKDYKKSPKKSGF